MLRTNFLLLLAITITTVCSQTSFVLKNYSVSPNYAKSVSSLYSFSYNAYNTIPGTINLRVDFPNNFELTTVTGCQIKLDSTVVGSLGCSFESSTNQVVLSNIAVGTLFSMLQIQFTTGTSKYSGSSTLELAFYNASNSNLITMNPEMVSIENAPMTCSLASTSPIVGASAVYTIQYTPIVQIQANSVIQLQLDSWGPFSRSNFLSTNTTAICAGQCTISLLPSFQLQLLTFSTLYSTPSIVSKTLILNSARNPSSFAPIKLKVVISASDGSSVYMTGSTTFAPSSTNAFNGLTFDLPNKSISSVNNNINLRITPRNPLNSNTFLRVIFPSSYVSLSYSFAFNSLVTTPQEVTGQPSGQLLLGNLARSTITSEPTLLSLGNFTLSNPPFGSKPVTVTFRTEQLINSTYFFIDESTISVTCNPSTILQYGVRPQLRNIGSTTSYDLWFINVNRLLISSYLIITFPPQTTLSTTSTCQLSTSGIASRCSILPSNTIKLILDSNLNSNTNLTITVTQVSNPLLTSPTSSFTIKTYFMDDTSLVDQLLSGMTLQATEVPLKSVIVTPSSTTVYARTSYTFSIQSSYDIPSSSIIKITFPQQFPEGGQLLQEFSIDSIQVTGCLFTPTTAQLLQFSPLCIKSQVKNTSNIKITLSNILNPTSFKPTDSFIVQVWNGAYKQEYLDSGVFVTMNQTALIPYLKVTPTSNISNQITSYTFEANFQIKRFSGDRLLIKYPADVPLSGVFNCSSLTTNLTISCSKIGSQTIQVILNFISVTYPALSLKFSIQNFTNMWYASTKTFSMQTTTNDTTFFYQEETSAIVNYQPAKLLTSINNDNNIVLLGDSKVTVELTSPFPLDKATNTNLISIVMQVPTDLVPKANTCSPSYGSALCNQTSAQVFNITSIGAFSSPLNIKFTAVTSYFESSSTFDIKLYYNSFLVLSSSELKAVKYCSSPCKACTTPKTQCLSCLPAPYAAETILFPFNSSCVTSCPQTYFLIQADKTCGKCTSSVCKTCQNSATECTSCQTGKYLLNKQCLPVCPDGYYGLNSQCFKCSFPCVRCQNQSTSCLSCQNGYFLDYGTNPSRCVQSCTNPNFIPLEGQCRQCTSNCKTCSVTVSNCTSCDEINYFLYMNSCIRSCPVGMYSSATGSCTNCEKPCLTCSTKLNCESCVAGYYFFNGSSCVTQCPNGYIEVVNDCMTCNPKCATCEVTQSNCTSCPSGSYFYQNDCYTTCPALTYPYNKTCTKCITPCLTCSSSPELCLSCIEPLLLLNSTCVAACPLSGYIQEDSKCLTCPQNCLTCQSSINCSLCSNEYFLLQGGCVSSCPVNYPIVQNRQCYQCSDACLTCETSKDNCTSCKINLFKHLYTCLESCPIGYFSNVKSYQCEDGLSSKIVFFPILILTVIILAFVSVVKCLTLPTSLPTALTALLSLTQMAIWIYIAAELAEPFKQLNMDYTLPIVMVAVALAFLLLANIAFFFLALKSMQSDDYVRGWANNNVNFTVLTVHRYLGLILNFKVFRLCYSRFFGLRTLSLPFKTNDNIFPLTTGFSLLHFLLSQVPMMVCSFSLVYKKMIKDQLFYSSVECLIITVFSAIILLVDIFKSETYFEESDYVQERKYLEKVKDASFNQLQDNFDIAKDEGSIEGQNFRSKTGGKFIYSKQDPSSLKQLFFQEEEVGSTISDGADTVQTKAQRKKDSTLKSCSRINIFDPIKEEEEELYDDAKYTEPQIKTQAQIQLQKVNETVHHKECDDGEDYTNQKQKRLAEFGINTDEANWDDNKSMIEERPLKQKWNHIIGHRQRLAHSIFNTLNEFSSKELAKIIEPIREDDYEDEGYQTTINNPFRSSEYVGKAKKGKKRRRRLGNQAPGNSELEKIYLQRLTEKKKYKDIFASSQSVKYDF